MNDPTAAATPQALPDFDLVLFGGTGDLAMRKLLPGLYRRHLSGDMAAGARIIAVARTAMSREAFVAQAEQSCRKRVGEAFDATGWKEFAARLSYLPSTRPRRPITPPGGDARPRATVVRVFFLSTAPGLFEVVCRELKASGMVTAASRIVLEEPLGSDTASANRINDVVAAAFAEHQIFRIDHYLGKETVQNLLALRFGNALFEPLWRRDRMRHVQITVAESSAWDARRFLRPHRRAARHGPEPPAAAALHHRHGTTGGRNRRCSARRKAQGAARSAANDGCRRDPRTPCAGSTAPALIGRASVPGYLDEAGVASESTTESFVALRVDIDSWRWAGVPFYLRTGKRLPDALAEIVVTFEQVPHSIFDGAAPSQPPTAS